MGLIENTAVEKTIDIDKNKDIMAIEELNNQADKIFNDNQKIRYCTKQAVKRCSLAIVADKN